MRKTSTLCKTTLCLVLSTVGLLCTVGCKEQTLKTSPTGVSIKTDPCRLDVLFYGEDIVRVVKSPLTGKADLAESFSVVARPRKVAFSVDNPSEKVVVLSTSALKVEVDLATGGVEFKKADGTPLTSEVPSSMTLAAGESDGPVAQAFCVDAEEPLYGLGQHKGQGIDWHGKSLHLENVNTEVAIPIVNSPKGYAIFWDNYSPTEFASKDTEWSMTSTKGNEVGYYFMYGGTPEGVIGKIRTLTGHVPMNSLWTFGFMQSKERYASAEELVGVLEKYRELQVPIDVVIQDWQYWGEEDREKGHYLWNAVQFLNPKYPDPKGMMEKIHSMGAHSLISVWPSFGKQTDIFAALQKENLLLDIETFPPGNGVKVYDVWNPRAREIYWNYMKDNIWDAGLDGWWLDATEPEHHKVKPEDYDMKTSGGTFAQVRNSFPIYSVGGVYDGQRSVSDEKRVNILTRSASTGQQRYGSHVWSGDLESSWKVLHEQVSAALGLSLSGIPYWNSDIGGFFSAGTYPKGTSDPEYRKLYVRWNQFGAFCSMMRSHGTNIPREIWRFGRPGDKDFDAVLKSINLRYRLLPYTYSTAWDVTSNDGTLMRALMMDYPTDPKSLSEDGEFLFGHSILVCPVFREDDKVDIYLPEGKWVNFWDGSSIKGGVSFSRTAPFDEIPLYVKAGSIIPVGPSVQYTDEKPWDSLQIRVYPGADGSFTLYEDSGEGYGYEKGEYSTIDFKWDDAASTLTISPRKGTYPGALHTRDFRVVAVRENSATGLDNISCDYKVEYDGKGEVKVKLQK